jgi:hypothetical protein
MQLFPPDVIFLVCASLSLPLGRVAGPGEIDDQRRVAGIGGIDPKILPQASLPPTPELRIPNAAAQMRIVSKARIRLGSRKSVRSFKGIICVDISEFESFSIGAGLCQALSDCSVECGKSLAGSSLLFGIETRPPSNHSCCRDAHQHRTLPVMWPQLLPWSSETRCHPPTCDAC